MNEYFYRGRNRQGNVVEGLCRAESLPDARRQLDKLGYHIALLTPREARRAPAPPEPPKKPPAPPRSGRATPRLGPDLRLWKPYLYGAFVLGLVWLIWDLQAGRPPASQAQVPQQSLVVEASLPGVRLADDDRIEFVFPDIPYTLEKSAKEAFSGGRVSLKVDLRSSRKPTYCLVRCRSARWERRIPLQP